MEEADLEAACAVARAALDPYVPADAPGRAAAVARRTAHLRATDPAGAWAAEQDGELIGLALSTVRDGLWVLSVLAVHPGRHARGTGGRLLRATLGHAEGTRGGLIASSSDPRAMRLYARAGFDLRPAVAAGGIVDRAAIPAGLRSRPSDDHEALAALGRPVRGGAYAAADLSALGLPFLAIEGRGFVAVEEGSPSMLCARDDEAAVDLLWSCFAAGPGGVTVDVDFLTAGQDWAVGACLAAGLALTPMSPIFSRGALGPLRPWLPSGALL